MIIIKTPQEIEKISKACKIVAETLDEIENIITPGLSTIEIESFAENIINKMGGTPAFKGYKGYPASICASVNNEVIHGIPSQRKLKEGDIVSLDLGVYLDGYYGDAAVTLPVGRISPLAEKLMRVTEKALYLGIEKAKKGNRVSDISESIQKHVESNGFSVVRSFVGHGIGSSLHEEPQIPNYGNAGYGVRLREGMTIAIEPMVNERGYEVRILDDKWTAVTADGGLSAHFEHTIAITETGSEILTKINRKTYNN